VSSATFLTLMYHIVDRTIDSRIAVTEEAFEAQLEHVRKEGHAVLNLDDVLRIVTAGDEAPQRSVFVTFDDGYEDNLYAALPRLRAHGIEATLFVPTAHVGHSNRWNPMACYDTRHLDWEELERWLEGGGRVGGHTHEHLCVGRLGAVELKTAIELNHKLLVERLGVDVPVFSYPFGAATDAARSEVARLYKAAFVVRGGTWNVREDPFRLNRLAVERAWDIAEFARHVDEFFESRESTQTETAPGR
jgi:peptidoglycan/xylan/chitin deacetylase (PgdA/CDA1 family)